MHESGKEVEIDTKVETTGQLADAPPEAKVVSETVTTTAPEETKVVSETIDEEGNKKKKTEITRTKKTVVEKVVEESASESSDSEGLEEEMKDYLEGVERESSKNQEPGDDEDYLQSKDPNEESDTEIKELEEVEERIVKKKKPKTKKVKDADKAKKTQKFPPQTPAEKQITNPDEIYDIGPSRKQLNQEKLQRQATIVEKNSLPKVENPPPQSSPKKQIIPVSSSESEQESEEEDTQVDKKEKEKIKRLAKRAKRESSPGQIVDLRDLPSTYENLPDPRETKLLREPKKYRGLYSTVLYEHEVNPRSKEDRLWYKQHRGENPHQAADAQKKTAPNTNKSEKKNVPGTSKKATTPKPQNENSDEDGEHRLLEEERLLRIEAEKEALEKLRLAKEKARAAKQAKKRAEAEARVFRQQAEAASKRADSEARKRAKERTDNQKKLDQVKQETEERIRKEFEIKEKLLMDKIRAAEERASDQNSKKLVCPKKSTDLTKNPTSKKEVAKKDYFASPESSSKLQNSKKSPKPESSPSKNTFQDARDQKKLERLAEKQRQRIDRELRDDYDYETGTFAWEREQGLRYGEEPYHFEYACVPSEGDDDDQDEEIEENVEEERDQYGFLIKKKTEKGKLQDPEFEEHYKRKEEMDLVRTLREDRKKRQLDEFRKSQHLEAVNRKEKLKHDPYFEVREDQLQKKALREQKDRKTQM